LEFSADVTHGLEGNLSDALISKPIQSARHLVGVTGEGRDGHGVARDDLFVNVVQLGQVSRVKFQMAAVLG